MNIEATKLEIMQLLLQTQKKDILLKVKKVFEKAHVGIKPDVIGVMRYLKMNVMRLEKE